MNSLDKCDYTIIRILLIRTSAYQCYIFIQATLLPQVNHFNVHMIELRLLYLSAGNEVFHSDGLEVHIHAQRERQVLPAQKQS